MYLYIYISIYIGQCVE